ncbi:hypothetical protein LCGC14_1656210 [marine sediment metagenome]|uniref:Uncharacterized protein n=1 Tax=marine sediment metagenome TaxID=412755 RepID=A0A0F9IHX1_9ZZZZ
MSETQTRLDAAYEILREKCDLPEYLLGEFLRDRGNSSIQTAFIQTASSISFADKEVEGHSTNQSLADSIRKRLIVSLRSQREYVKFSIEKLGGQL